MDPNTTEFLHLIADGFVCNTEGRGHATPGGRPPTELVVDASEGFIPLWHAGSILKWRFQERSFALAADPNASQAIVIDLMSEALLRWGSAAPVKFTRDTDLWDFEVVLRNALDVKLCESNAGRTDPATGEPHSSDWLVDPSVLLERALDGVHRLRHRAAHLAPLINCGIPAPLAIMSTGVSASTRSSSRGSRQWGELADLQEKTETDRARVDNSLRPCLRLTISSA